MANELKISKIFPILINFSWLFENYRFIFLKSLYADFKSSATITYARLISLSISCITIDSNSTANFLWVDCLKSLVSRNGKLQYRHVESVEMFLSLQKLHRWKLFSFVWMLNLVRFLRLLLFPSYWKLWPSQLSVIVSASTCD